MLLEAFREENIWKRKIAFCFLVGSISLSLNLTNQAVISEHQTLSRLNALRMTLPK